MTLRVGVVGRGPWSAKVQAALQRDFPHVRVVFVTGRDWMMHSEDAVDAVFVVCHPGGHQEVAFHFGRRGIPCFVEKPLVIGPVDPAWQSIFDRVVLWVDHVYLFHPAYEALRQILRGSTPQGSTPQGGVESLRVVVGGRGPLRPDVPMMWDWGPHALAYVADLCPAEQLTPEPVVTPGAGGLTTRLRGARFPITVHFGATMPERRNWVRVRMGRTVYQLNSGELWQGGTLLSPPSDGRLPLTRSIAAFLQACEQGYPPGPAPLSLAVKVGDWLSALPTAQPSTA